MNDGELRILEYVSGQIDGLRADIREWRQADAEWKRDHAQTDRGNFGEIFRRLKPLEDGHAVQEHQVSEDRLDKTRWDAWQIALLGVLGVIAAGIVSAVLTARLMGGH